MGSFGTHFGDFLGVRQKSGNLSPAIARAPFSGSEEVLFWQFLLTFLHMFSRSPLRGVRRGLVLHMGRFWGRLGDPLGAPFGKKPLLGAENSEPFSVSGSRGGPGPLFGRFWDDFSVDFGVNLGYF